MPKNQQNTPQPIDPIRAANKAESATCGTSDEKLTMLNIVSATEVETKVTIIMPIKFATAAIIKAAPGFKHLVETAVAMAFGASVAPETIVTNKTSTRTAPSAGYIGIILNI